MVSYKRKHLQLRLRFIQEYAVAYGALPDPKDGWKYFVRPDGQYLCWKCGAEVISQVVHNSIHFAEFRGMAGGGEVIRQEVPYCPSCEPVPRDGIVRETIAQSIACESRGIPRPNY